MDPEIEDNAEDFAIFNARKKKDISKFAESANTFSHTDAENVLSYSYRLHNGQLFLDHEKLCCPYTTIFIAKDSSWLFKSTSVFFSFFRLFIYRVF